MVEKKRKKSNEGTGASVVQGSRAIERQAQHAGLPQPGRARACSEKAEAKAPEEWLEDR